MQRDIFLKQLQFMNRRKQKIIASFNCFQLELILVFPPFDI